MNAESSTWLGRVLNLVGALAVGFYFTQLVIEGLPEWTVLLGSASLLAWLVVLFLPRRLLLATGLLFAVMGVAGALVAVPTAGLMVVPPAIGVLRLLADPRRALWQGVAAWLAGAGLVAAGVFFNDLPPYALLTIEGGLLIAALGGYSRRQYRESEERMRALAEEHARAVVQEHRQSVAREIHDVLAHSLGGLVVQLDAVGALLEAGRTGEATARVTDARALAVAGLTEAKRAVEALREDLPIEAVDLPGAIDDLVRAHRSLGGETDLIVEGVPHSLSAAASVAIARTLQEALTNARKHAPGMPVFVTVHWSDTSVSLEVSNALSGRTQDAPGGGHGIEGMRERFAALPGSVLSAESTGGRFAVIATVPA